MLYSNFTQQVWYTPKSQDTTQKPVRFLLQTIPYRFTSIADLVMHGVQISVNDFILHNCVIDYQNIITDIPKDIILRDLESYISKDMFDEVIDKVMELWVPDSKFLSTLVTTVELMVDPRFSDGSWNCITCQKRKLDRQRNCPLIDGTEHLDAMFKLPFMGETITACPVSDKDEALGKLLLEGYNFRDLGVLPESGGMGDQPILFVTGTQHLAERVKYFQSQADEESLKQTSK